MSDTGGPSIPTTGTAQIMDNLASGAGPGFREHDGREAGDIESARTGVDLLFASIGSGLCPDGSVLDADRDRLLWNAVEQLRSHAGRLEARLESRLREPTPEQREQRARDNEADGGETDYLLAHGAENIREQIAVLRRTLDHALHRYGEVVGRPWLARHGTVGASASEYGLGAQVDASAWFAARALWKPAPDVLTRVREAMEHADMKRAELRAAAGNREPPARLEDLGFPFDAGGREETAAAVAGMFRALDLIYPDGTQLQDERRAGAWRAVRLFDAGASGAAEDALRRMTDHPALGSGPDPEAAARFDEGTRASMLRVQLLSRAADAAGVLYCETTGEEAWKRRDPSMTAAGGPRDRTSLTGLHYAAAQRVAALGRPAPHPLDGPHIVIVGSAALDMDRDREAVEARLARLHERAPHMVLHYGARLRDRGGVDRNRGIDAIVHRWATGRRVALVPNPPFWDAGNERYDLHGRDDAWIAMKPDLVVDFDGAGNAHRRFLALAKAKGVEIRSASTGRRAQAEERSRSSPGVRPQAGVRADGEPRALVWAGIGARGTPAPVLADMTALAGRMAGAGFHLVSGGAGGADAAFAAGTPVGQRTLWLPWEGFNDLAGPDCRTLAPERLRDCMAVAERLHPAWDKCRPGVRRMHARNAAILLGPTLDRPVDAVVCWTEGGRIRGGTGMGLLIAREWNIPVINLASAAVQSAWERLRELPQRPPAMRAASATASRTRDPDPDRRRALRQQRLQARWRGMLHGLTLPHLPRAVLADLHRETARTAAEERLDSLSRDRLIDALDSIEDQARQSRAELDAGGRPGPHAVETGKRIAALDAAGDRIHAVLAERNLAALREQEGLDTKIAGDTQSRVLSVMLSVYRLTSEGPLAMEPNLLVGAAAGVFLAEAGEVGRHLADEARLRSGLALAHTAGSEEETLALASRGPDPKTAGEAFEHMQTDVELKERDEQYRALAMRSRFLDVMAETAQTFARASRVDMRRQAADREARRTRHLEDVASGPAVQRRRDELRDAHRQLIDGLFGNLAALCPVDHVSAADPRHGSNSDRDRLLARFASLFRSLGRKLDRQLAQTPAAGRNARNADRRREAAAYLRALAGYAEKALGAHTDRAPLVWTPRATQTAGEWLMERERRAHHRQKAEALAPDGRHVAIVGGRGLHDRYAGRIAELLNRERAANPDKPLVLHCIAQEGAGRYAAEWAASHGVTCVTHRPQRYSPAHLKRRDDLLLGIPPDAVWNFGAEDSRERAASMLLDRIGEQPDAVEVRDMASELEGPLSGEAVIETREQVEREYARIHHAWQKADALSGDGVLVYREGVEALLPDINRTLARPHLAGGERRFLNAFGTLIESETRVRDEISRAIDRARDHLASYEAILERRGPDRAGAALNDIDSDYRRWDVRAEMIVQTFDNWFATDNAAHREHLDRRRLDLTDLGAEIRAVRKAARDPQAEPHRVEVSLETGVHSWDQLFDRKRFTELALETLKPEEERNPGIVAEFARWARAWPDETRTAFRAITAEAARAQAPLHTRRLAASLPPGLAAGMSHISEEIWSYQGEEIMKRQAARSRGMGLSA